MRRCIWSIFRVYLCTGYFYRIISYMRCIWSILLFFLSYYSICEKVYLVNISGIFVHRLFLSYHFIHEVYLVNIVVFSIVLFHM